MKRTVLAAMLLLAACNVLADNEAAEWRIGASLSYSEYERDDNLIDDASTGFKAHAQYRFNQWAGVEGGFYVSPDFKDDVAPTSGGGEAETSFQGITLNGIAYLPSPIESVDLFLKGGYFNFFDADLEVDGVTTDSGDEDGLTLGLGASLDTEDGIGIRVEFDWYDTKGADLWTIGIGAEYRF